MIEFGETADIELSGEKGTFTTEAKIDTGAARTTVDYNLAATIGAGPVTTTINVTSASGNDRRPVAKLTVRYEMFEDEIEVGLADRKSQDLDYMMIIGKDILGREDVIINI